MIDNFFSQTDSSLVEVKFQDEIFALMALNAALIFGNDLFLERRRFSWFPRSITLSKSGLSLNKMNISAFSKVRHVRRLL